MNTISYANSSPQFTTNHGFLKVFDPKIGATISSQFAVRDIVWAKPSEIELEVFMHQSLNQAIAKIYEGRRMRVVEISATISHGVPVFQYRMEGGMPTWIQEQKLISKLDLKTLIAASVFRQANQLCDQMTRVY